MTPFRTWRHRLGISQREAAEALGYSWTQVQKFDAGTADTPKVVELAMETISRRELTRRAISSLGIKDLPPQG